MRGILLVARRDFAAYVNTIWGWLIIAVALFIDGVFFHALALTNTAQYSADVLSKFFFNSGGVALGVGVVVTMRLFAEERQTGTMVLLESSPLSDRQLVFGKYLSAMMFMAFLHLLSLYMPAMIFVNGKVSIEQIAVGYLGIMLMSSAGVAIGTWASSVSRNQILAAVLGGVLVLMFVLCHWLAKVTDAPFKELFANAAFYAKQFAPFEDGRVNTENVFYFVSLTFGFLLLATQSLTARRWE
jgi:ABC-2 type transport system permease protein